MALSLALDVEVPRETRKPNRFPGFASEMSLSSHLLARTTQSPIYPWIGMQNMMSYPTVNVVYRFVTVAEHVH